jgi:hypothetical protein
MLDLAARSEPEEWFGLHTLYEVIHNESIKPRFTLNAIGDVLKRELSALVEALGPKFLETKKDVEQRRKQRLGTLGIRPR